MRVLTPLAVVFSSFFYGFLISNSFVAQAQELTQEKKPPIVKDLNINKPTPPVSIQSGKPNLRDDWQEQVKKWTQKWNGEIKVGPKDRIERNTERFCLNVKSRLGERWQRYYQNRANQLERIQEVLLILQAKVDYFNSKGLNTSELQNDLNTLSRLVEEYKESYNYFLTLLEQIKDLDCKNYENEFLTKLKQVRDAWLVVRSKRETIRNFYISDIKPDLESLRNQLSE